METIIPCVLMRGGTSRGPFFLADWLPADPAERDRLLLTAMGSPHALQVDGLGGGNSLTSKVAIVSRSRRPGCDIDYLFAQVSVDQASVDLRPNCGNMLSGAAPFAIDEGLLAANDGVTSVRVHNVNTGSVIEAIVQTPGGRLTYEGAARIDGVAGTAAPVRLNFLDAWGAVTGGLFPSGQRQDDIDGLRVTLIDAAMPMALMRASDLGARGDETPAELDANPALMARIEAVRLEAGRRMGLGDVRDSVLPSPCCWRRARSPWRCARVISRHGPAIARMPRPARWAWPAHFSYRARWRMASAARSRPLAAVACASSIRRGRWISRWSLVTTASRYGAPVWCAPRERS